MNLRLLSLVGKYLVVDRPDFDLVAVYVADTSAPAQANTIKVGDHASSIYFLFGTLVVQFHDSISIVSYSLLNDNLWGPFTKKIATDNFRINPAFFSYRRI